MRSPLFRAFFAATAVLLLLAPSSPVAAQSAATRRGPFAAPIIEERPRLFLGRGRFEGLTIAKLRRAAATAEYAGIAEKWTRTPSGRALRWLVHGRREDLEKAIVGLKEMRAAAGTWSDRGLELMEMATLFDWLYPELDAATRRESIARLEAAADAAQAHVEGGQAPFFYSRTPSALAGVVFAGIALHGVSRKANAYLECFRRWGVEEYFQSLAWVDGAATGSLYTMFYTYTAVPALCAAWWSATGRNPAKWIRDRQGDWLGGMLRFYRWYLRPGFAFTDINDQSRDIWSSHDQYCRGLDLATYLTRDGLGRAWAERWRGRFGAALYHAEYAHHVIFSDPEVKPKPLTRLPRAAMFGRESCGYGFFRSHWPADGRPDTATHVFFRCGDPMDVHGGVSAGEFQIFKHAPLAARSGSYCSYDSPADQYHRNCISTNVVLFLDPRNPEDRGDQNTRRGLKDNHGSWAEWLAIRRSHRLDVARVLDWQVKEGLARCRADLSGTNSRARCRTWTREFLWLADRHLVVLDVVEAARPEIRRLWQLHSVTSPEIEDHLVTISNEPPKSSWHEPGLQPKRRVGRLFCQTLVPRDYTLTLHAEGQARSFDASGHLRGATEGNPYHREFGSHVIQIDPGNRSARTAFLHVLTATDAPGEHAPEVSLRKRGSGSIEVTIGSMSATLKVPRWFPD